MQNVNEHWSLASCIFHSAFLFVFSFCCQTAPDMPLLFVQIQYLTHLQIQSVVILLQPVGKILMYRGFGNAEMPGGCPDGGTGFDHVHSHFAGPLLHWLRHWHPSDAVC